MFHVTGLPRSNDGNTVIVAVKQVLCIVESGTGEPYWQFLDTTLSYYLSEYSECYALRWHGILPWWGERMI